MKSTAESVTAALDLLDRTYLVTGASSGVGLEAARVLALRGARVLFACRNVKKAEAVIAAAALPDGARARCVVEACDLASLASAHAMVDRLQEARVAIDGVALNAGVFGMPYRLTDDGLEYTYASNYAGHFVLLHGLLQHRLLAPTGRVLATLSENVRMNPFLRADLPMLLAPEENRRKFGSYASPNAKVLMALALEHAITRTEGTVYTAARFDGCDPGGTLTDNVNQLGKVGGFFAKALAPLLFKPVEEGAAVIAWAMCHPSLSTSSEPADRAFRYYTPDLAKRALPTRWQKPELAAEVWAKSEAKLGTGSLSLD